MITLKNLEEGLSWIEDRWGKLADSTRTIFSRYFNDNLDDEEFLAAAFYVICHYDFMPSPSKFVEYIQGSKEAKALQEWQLIVQSSGRPDPDLSYLSGRGRIALKAIAGIRAVAQGSIDTRSGMSELQRLEKKFVAVYLRCSAQDRRTLSQVESPVSEPSVDEEGAKEPSAPPEGWFENQMRILASRKAMVKKTVLHNGDMN